MNLQDEMIKILIAWQFPKARAILLSGELLEAVELSRRAAVAAERERCAQVAESPFGPGLADRDDYWQPRIAAAIRALD